jgi:hypothetical protein
VAVFDGRQVQPCRDDHDREHADGHVHVEDPAPREVVHEEAAEQRARDRGDGEDATDQPHVATAIAGRDDVCDDRLRADHQPAGAHTLEEAERDQLVHRLAQSREHRADEEDQDRSLEDRLAAQHVAELPVERRRDRGGEQVRRHDPGQVVQPAEVADDRRQGGRDDRLVERGQEHPEHQCGEDRAERSPGGLCNSSGRSRCLRGHHHLYTNPALSRPGPVVIVS